MKELFRICFGHATIGVSIFRSLLGGTDPWRNFRGWI